MSNDALGTAAIFTALTGAVSYLAKRLIDSLQKERDECRAEVKELRVVVDGHASRVEKLAEDRAAELAALRNELVVLKTQLDRSEA